MPVFGPIPSRRLGRSLGINNIPPKACSYACIYCQVGFTTQHVIERSAFIDPDELTDEIINKVESVKSSGEKIDYLTFVPDGEPTLDINLGKLIDMLKPLGIPIAVISNGSLITDADVRDDLSRADLVSAKIDAVVEDTWRKINNPHKHLILEDILKSIREFSKDFNGELITETMLVDGINDDDAHAHKLAAYLFQLSPDMSYISIPTRPPARSEVKPPSEDRINQFFQIVKQSYDKVSLLVDYEGDEFTSTHDPSEDLLAITSVHPMREDAVRMFLVNASSDWDMVDKLIEDGRLIRVKYGDHWFYMRKTPGRQ